jgi:hypothetical protein
LLFFFSQRLSTCGIDLSQISDVAAWFNVSLEDKLLRLDVEGEAGAVDFLGVGNWASGLLGPTPGSTPPTARPSHPVGRRANMI